MSSIWRQDLCIKSSGKPEISRLIFWREVGDTDSSANCKHITAGDHCCPEPVRVVLFLITSVGFIVWSFYCYQKLRSSDNIIVRIFSLTTAKGVCWPKFPPSGRGGAHTETNSLRKEFWKAQKSGRGGGMRRQSLGDLPGVGLCFAFEAEWGDRSSEGLVYSFTWVFSLILINIQTSIPFFLCSAVPFPIPSCPLSVYVTLPLRNPLAAFKFLFLCPFPVWKEYCLCYFSCVLPRSPYLLCCCKLLTVLYLSTQHIAWWSLML